MNFTSTGLDMIYKQHNKADIPINLKISEDLTEFGFSNTQRWYDVFKINPDECLYIREMLRQEEGMESIDQIVQIDGGREEKGEEGGSGKGERGRQGPRRWFPPEGPWRGGEGRG